MKNFRIALTPGDGIGPEIISEAIKVLKAIEKTDGKISFSFDCFTWGAEYYLNHGEAMPENALDVLCDYDAVLLGAVGDPRVDDTIAAEQMLYAIRRGFDQYVNLRPVKRFAGAPNPLSEEKRIDIVFVRENLEGEYAPIGGGLYGDGDRAMSIQTAVFTRWETERVMRYAFELARKRSGKVTSLTKSNALKYSMVFWDRVFNDVRKDYLDVRTEQVLVDAMAMFMITKPETFDVVVASNLFGDIITDLGAAIQGGLGFAAGGNINPTGKYPSMFEPIGGSAPKYKGMNIANPTAAILAAGMMLENLGFPELRGKIVDAAAEVVGEGKVRTKDMGGTNSTTDVGDAIAGKILSGGRM